MLLIHIINSVKIKFDSFFLIFYLQEVPDENYDLPYNQTETNGDAVMIKMDVPNREEPSFPKEKWKSLIGKLVQSPFDLFL